MEQKICTNAQCKKSFRVEDEDLEFYEKVSPVFAAKKYLISAPTQCPDCRFQRRMVWRREHSLHNRTCDLCKKSIVSVHTEDVPYSVYCVKCFWSDNWDASSFGRDIDLSRPFFDQFAELLSTAPQMAMMNDNGVASENCEYCQDFGFSKNCYLVTGAWLLEDCYYSDCNCLHSKKLFDCYAVHFSEIAYWCYTSQKLFRCSFMDHCENCNDCMFGIDLKGCKNCIGCVGLRQKEYCILNEQLTKDEYLKRKEELKLDSRSGLEAFKKKFAEWSLQFPRKSNSFVNCENCTGDDLFHCKNVTMGFQFEGAEYCKYVVHGDSPKNCMDVTQTGKPEWCMEGATPDNSYMTHFTTWCWKDKYVLYSDNCHSCEHLFGCIGMKRRKHCILNKQYSKEEYEDLCGKIIEKMTADGQWGEFWPMTMSPYFYNETFAHQAFPLTKEKVLSLGLRWNDHNPKQYKPQTYVLPDSIADVSDDVIDQTLACTVCSRNFKILQQELDFYRDMKLPVPGKCYECRFDERASTRNPRRLWKRSCAKCGDEIQTSYAPERPQIVYCENCYLETVY